MQSYFKGGAVSVPVSLLGGGPIPDAQLLDLHAVGRPREPAQGRQLHVKVTIVATMYGFTSD